MNTKHTYGFEGDEVLTLNGLEIGRIHASLEVKDELIRRLNCHDALAQALKAALPQIRSFHCTDPNGETCGNPVIEQVRKSLALAGDGRAEP